MIPIGAWSFVPDNPIGITAGYNTAHTTDPQYFTDMTALGASRIRINVVIDFITPATPTADPSAWTWGFLDNAVQQANQAGIRVTLIARGLIPTTKSAWTTTSPCDPNASPLKYPTTADGYTLIAVMMARRYSGDGNPQNAIVGGKALQADIIEIGNEEFSEMQDTSGNWTRCQNPMKFVNYVRNILPILRAPTSETFTLSFSSGNVTITGGNWVTRGNFQARVGAWGITHSIQKETIDHYTKMCTPPTDATWNPSGNHNSIFGLDQTLNCRMLDYANFHNYNTSGYTPDLQCTDIRKILNNAGNAQTPIWCTEAGADGPVACTGATEQSQSNYFAPNTDGSGNGMLAKLKAAGLQHIDIFTINYIVGTCGSYKGQAKAIACALVAGGYKRFLAFQTTINFLKLDNGAWAAQPVPNGFGGGSSPPPPPPPGTGSFAVTPTSLSYSATAGGANPANQSITISNTGTLDGTWSLSVTSLSGGAWLSGSPTSGALNAGASATVPFTATVGSLTAGTYNATINVVFTPSGMSQLTASVTASFVVAAASGAVHFANPGDNLQTKVNALTPGDTLILNDGKYTEAHGLRITGVNGTSSQHIMVKANNDGKAIIDGGGSSGSNEPCFINNSSYIDISGLVFQNSHNSVVYLWCHAAADGVNHITFRRCTAHGTGSGNEHVWNVASDNGGMTNILLEDCAAWGPGRYMFSCYHCGSGIIFRRCYGYWDKITDNVLQPRAPLNIYGTSNALVENFIGIHAIPYQKESVENYYTAAWQTTDDTSNWPATNCQILGSVFYNNYDGYFISSTAGGGTLFKDCYFESGQPANTGFTNTPYGEAFHNDGGPGTHSATNCTFRNSNTGLLEWSGSHNMPLLNCIFIGNKTAISNDTSHTFCDFFDNTANGITLDSSDKAVDPGYQITTYGRGGALFIPASSPLSGTGSGGADIGANILYQYVDGSLTSTPLWPWPMEDRIMSELGISPTYAANSGLFTTLTNLYGVSPPPPPPPPPPPGPPPSSGGSLVGTFTALGAETINLTSEGTSDWIHIGYKSPSSFDHKTTGNTQISDPFIIGNGILAQNKTAIVSATWSDGTPDGSASNTPTGSRMTPPATTGAISKYLYVATAGNLYIYDMNNNFTLTKTVSISQLTTGVRGVACAPSVNALFFAYGSDEEVSGNGGLLRYNLLTDSVTYAVMYNHGIDQLDVTSDGSTVYMPAGEFNTGKLWHVINANTGAETGATISVGKGPHNTAISLDGTKIYLGPRFGMQFGVYTIATGTLKLLDTITYANGCRPFTFNNAQTWLALTENHLGFEVFDLNTGHILYTVAVPGYTWNGATWTTPCHGISMNPQETEIYLLDAPHNCVHVFDISSTPASAPTLITTINCSGNFNSNEGDGCPYDCLRYGWLTHSLDGNYVFVHDMGDIIDTSTRTIAHTLTHLSNTRHGALEIDFQNGVAIATTTHFGLGRA